MTEFRPPIMAAIIPTVSLLLVLVLGHPVIALLKRARAGQRVRDDGPHRHLQKEGTPTMGGVLIIAAAVAAVVVGGALDHAVVTRRAWLLLAATVAFGLIGLADDCLKIRKGRSLGLKARQKLVLQCAAAVAFMYALGADMPSHDYPGAPPYPRFPGWEWIGFWALATVLTSNAANLADGLDGLAAGLTIIAAAGLTLMAPGKDVAAVSLSLLGACLGFLWFNRHPARVFMGDVGSLALGAAIAGGAAVMHNPIALAGLFLVPYLEAGSVVAQVISFKTTGKRIFRMSPVHHHFELLGWSEQRVVWTFWIVAAAAAAVTVGITLASRG